jgi:hypothetical protein
MRKRIHSIWFWMGMAALVGTPFPSYSQARDSALLSLDVDRTEVGVGDELTVIIEFSQGGTGNAALIRQPSIATSEHFEIRSQATSVQETGFGNAQVVVSKTKLILVATKPGTEVLGPAVALYRDSRSKKKEISSETVTVTIAEKSLFSFLKKKNSPAANRPSVAVSPLSTLAPDPLGGLKPLAPESHWFLKTLFWLALFGAIGGFIWWKTRPTPKGAEPPPPEKAAQLRDVWKKLANEDLSGKEFCLGLSSLVRECLQYRFGFFAVDFTTEEIFKELEKRKLTDNEREAVEKCLKTCDRVLYADGNLTGRDNLRSLCSALLPKVQK